MAKTKDYGLGEHDFPRGWFMIADASEVTQTPQAIRFFGRDMVLYRGKSGRPVLLDAFCPLVRLLDRRREIAFLVGLIEREIVVRAPKGRRPGFALLRRWAIRVNGWQERSPREDVDRGMEVRRAESLPGWEGARMVYIRSEGEWEYLGRARAGAGI